MKTPFRYMYNPAFFERLCPVLNRYVPDFDSRDFVFRIFNNAWPDMELKDRVRHISGALHHFLPKDFRQSAQIIITISHSLKRQDFPRQGFENIFLADYVEMFGSEYPDLSAQVKKEIRKAIGADYALSPSLIEDKI